MTPEAKPLTMSAERWVEICKLGSDAEWPDTMHILRFALRDALKELDSERAAHRQTQEELEAYKKALTAVAKLEQMLPATDRETQCWDSGYRTACVDCGNDSLRAQLEQAYEQCAEIADGERMTWDPEKFNEMAGFRAASHIGTAILALRAKPELVDTEHGMTTGELADLWPKIAKPEAVSTQGDEGRSRTRPYDVGLHQRLQSKEYCVEYLLATKDDPDGFALAVADIIAAYTKPTRDELRSQAYERLKTEQNLHKETLVELGAANNREKLVRAQLERTQEVKEKLRMYLQEIFDCCNNRCAGCHNVAESALAEAAK